MRVVVRSSVSYEWLLCSVRYSVPSSSSPTSSISSASFSSICFYYSVPQIHTLYIFTQTSAGKTKVNFQDLVFFFLKFNEKIYTYTCSWTEIIFVRIVLIDQERFYWVVVCLCVCLYKNTGKVDGTAMAMTIKSALIFLVRFLVQLMAWTAEALCPFEYIL